MATTNTRPWVEILPVNSYALHIELKRIGHLWHGQASRLCNRAIIHIEQAKATGTDFEYVRYQVLQSAHMALRHYPPDATCSTAVESMPKK